MSARLGALVCLTLSLTPGLALACPFCTAVGPTFGEEMAEADAAVLARPVAGPTSDPDRLTRTWRVERALKGQPPEMIVAPRVGETSAVHYIVGRKVEGRLEWSLPLETTPALADYLTAVSTRPAEASERLWFFQDYLEHEDRLIADDAYNEFGKAPYAELQTIRDHMDRTKLLSWIGDSDITFVRRKLYLTMLGVCGSADDAAAVRALVESPRPSHRNALDAAIACYVVLTGEAGLSYVEEKFLRPTGRDTSLMVSGIAAIRFHGEELHQIPRPRLCQSLAVVLEHPPAADLVLADLARWGDWSHIDRLGELFEHCPEDALHIRAPIARYLLACPEPAAATQLERLRGIDEASVRQAEGMLLRPRSNASAPAELASAESPADDGAVSGPIPAAPPEPTSEDYAKIVRTGLKKMADDAGDEAGIDLLATLGGVIGMAIAGIFAFRLR